MEYKSKNCKYCNKDISYKNWSHHVKTKKHTELSGSINSSLGATAKPRVYSNKHCDKCNKDISYKNWSHHIKTNKHKSLAPSEKKTTIMSLRARAKEMNLNGISKMNKQELQSYLIKIEQISETTLNKMNKAELLIAAKEYKVKVNVGMKKSKIIDAILRPQMNKFKKNVTQDLSFSDELFEPSRERKTEHSISEVETALQSRLKTYKIVNKKGILDIERFLEDVRELVVEKISASDMDLKVNLVLLADFKKGLGKNAEHLEKNFKTENEIVLKTTDVGEYFSKASGKIQREMEEFYARGSNWALRRIKSLEVRLNRYIPLRGASYMELPDYIRKKRAIINVKNQDNKCFLWAILSALHPAHDNAERVTNYTKYQHEFDGALEGLEFPIRLVDIPKFEKRSGVSINVFAYDDEKKCVHPLQITKNKTARHVNLFYTKDKTNSHFCWIKNMSALVRSQMTKHWNRIHICDRCLCKFSSEWRLQEHEEYCKEHDPVRISLPRHDKNTLKFGDYNNSMRVPFVIYADFESILEKREEDLYRIAHKYNIDPIGKTRDVLVQEIFKASGVSYKREDDKPFTIKYQKHKPVSFCYYVKSTLDDKFNQIFDYVGEDAAEVFVKMLEKESKYIKIIYNHVVPMEDLTAEEKFDFDNASECHICKHDLGEDKVRDHNHLTGRYRGAAHSNCNLNYKNPKFIPVFIHNLAGYDTHLFIKEFGFEEEKINMIPNNEERYISFSATVKAEQH